MNILEILEERIRVEFPHITLEEMQIRLDKALELLSGIRGK